MKSFFFTELTHWVSQCPYVVCLCHRRKHGFLVDWKLLVEERITYFDITLDIFEFCCFHDCFQFDIFGGFQSFQTSLLFIMGELVGGCGCWG